VLGKAVAANEGSPDAREEEEEAAAATVGEVDKNDDDDDDDDEEEEEKEEEEEEEGMEVEGGTAMGVACKGTGRHDSSQSCFSSGVATAIMYARAFNRSVH